MTHENTPTATFYLDPICPWAYRTSLWIREARKVRPIEIEWKFLSLRAVNEGTENLKDAHSMSQNAFRLMALARREHGEEAVDRLYETIGRARHEERQDIGDVDVLKRATQEAGFDPELVDRALADESTLDEVQTDHQSGVECGAFGVPTIQLNGECGGFFGPVISEVPEGEAAGRLWDHFAWFANEPSFYEIKRVRT
ncbi:MAG TPA: DsbA family protein [Chloroflexota bacterium]|nr:DsbA family protein [Chloroflexota bacterium]